MYLDSNSYSAHSKCVAALANACIDLRQKYGYSDPDARTVALDNITAIARGGQMILNLLDSWVIGDDSVRQVIPQLLGLESATTQSVDFAGKVLDKTGKLSLVLVSQFQIENLIRNVSLELEISVAGTGFYRRSERLLEALGISKARMSILNTPARIRNSLHANGIHHKTHPNETSVIKIRDVVYEFHDGEAVNCASWAHIAHALEASISVLEEILDSKEVLCLSDPLLDQYAWEQETDS